MSSGTNFDSTKLYLEDFLKDIDNGKLQLPDFQRGWVWNDYHIRSLLASISLAFPIGAVMTLETGGKDIRFKPRPIEGTKPSISEIEPETLILDGQQRLTSLYQALFGKNPVKTKDAKGKYIQRRYYIDMKSALNNSDREEAIISVPEDGIVKGFRREILVDVSTKEKEYQNGLFPAALLFDSAEWRQEYSKYWDYSPEKTKHFDKFESDVIKRFERYQIPVIKLSKETSKEAVCLVFEKVNTGGVSLTVFELLTATFAAENFQLRDNWRKREKHLKTSHPILKSLQNDDFLQAVSLIATYHQKQDAIKLKVGSDRAPAISCKRRDILRLTVDDYSKWAGRESDDFEQACIVNGFKQAVRFLHRQKIFKANDIPYRTQIVPLATIFVALDKEAESDGAFNKISRWFWCGVLGELYGGAIETRFARDLPEVIEFVRFGREPTTIIDANFAANRLLTLRTRNSAAYKGIYALLMRDGCLDFRTGEPIEYQTFFSEDSKDSIDIHHIFPKEWCIQQGIEPSQYNSIINKTAISARTNRIIGKKAPSDYLETLQKKAEITSDRMDEILRTHRINPENLRNNDFQRFFEERAEELLSIIEKAMGKTISRDPEVFRSGRSVDEYVEEQAEWEDEVIPDMGLESWLEGARE